MQSEDSKDAAALPRERRRQRRLDLALALILGSFLPWSDRGEETLLGSAALPPRLQPQAGARLEDLGLSDLRRIRGVGPARARAIRQALWRAGGALPLEQISGVGEKTAAEIQAWLAARGLPPSPAGAGQR